MHCKLHIAFILWNIFHKVTFVITCIFRYNILQKIVIIAVRCKFPRFIRYQDPREISNIVKRCKVPVVLVLSWGQAHPFYIKCSTMAEQEQRYQGERQMLYRQTRGKGPIRCRWASIIRFFCKLLSVSIAASLFLLNTRIMQDVVRYSGSIIHFISQWNSQQLKKNLETYGHIEHKLYVLLSWSLQYLWNITTLL